MCARQASGESSHDLVTPEFAWTGVSSVPRFSITGLGFRVLAQTARGFLGQSNDLGGWSRFPGLGSGMEFVAVNTSLGVSRLP